MPKTVLIVENSKIVRDMVGFALRQGGYNVVEADSGQRALLSVANVDCIVTGLDLPMMDGIELIREIRTAAAAARNGSGLYKDVPILMMAGKGEDFRRAAGRKAGANGHLQRPVHPRALLDAVGQACNW